MEHYQSDLFVYYGCLKHLQTKLPRQLTLA